MPRGSLIPTTVKERGSVKTSYEWEEEGRNVQVRMSVPNEALDASTFMSSMAAKHDQEIDVLHAVVMANKRSSIAAAKPGAVPKVAITVLKEDDEPDFKSKSRVSYRAQLLMDDDEKKGSRRNMHFQNIGRSGVQRLRRKLQRLRNDPDGTATSMAIIADMKNRGYRPDAASYTAVILSCQAGKKWNELMAFLEEMRTARMRPDRSVFAAAIMACERLGKWEDGLGLLEEMKQERNLNPDIASLQCMVRACEKAGAWKAAYELLNEVNVAERVPVVVFEEVVQGIVKNSVSFETEGGDRVSVDVLRQADGESLSGRNTRGSSDVNSAFTSNNTSRRASNINTQGHASRTRSRAESPGPGQSAAAEAAQAMNALQQAAAFAEASVEILREQMKGIHPQEQGSCQQALDLLAEMQEQGHSPDRASYDIAIACCSVHKEWKSALDLFNQMRKEDIKPSQDAFKAAATATERLGLWSQTLTLVKEMKARGFQDTQDTKLVAFKACGRAGQWHEAFSLLSEAAEVPERNFEEAGIQQPSTNRIWTAGIFKRRFRRKASASRTENKYNA